MVITIVVLLIISGVAIAGLTENDKNIMDKAKEAKEKTVQGEETDINALEDYATFIDEKIGKKDGTTIEMYTGNKEDLQFYIDSDKNRLYFTMEEENYYITITEKGTSTEELKTIDETVTFPIGSRLYNAGAIELIKDNNNNWYHMNYKDGRSRVDITKLEKVDIDKFKEASDSDAA